MIGLDIENRRLYVAENDTEYIIPTLPTSLEEQDYIKRGQTAGTPLSEIYADPAFPPAKHNRELYETLEGLVLAGWGFSDTSEFFTIDTDFWLRAPKSAGEFNKEFDLADIVCSPSSTFRDRRIPVDVRVSVEGSRISLCGGSCECSRTLEDTQDNFLFDHNLGPGDKGIITLGALAYNHLMAEG